MVVKLARFSTLILAFGLYSHLMYTFDTLAFSIACFTTFYLYQWRRRRSGPLPLPPGPKGLPFIGNLLDMPLKHEWLTYLKWCKDYDTNIISLNILGSSLIVLNTYEASIDLLESRSSIYSGRPQSTMVNDLMGWGFDFGFMQYGEKWRQHRRIMHHNFHPTAADKFKPHSLKAARDLLQRWLEDSNDILADFKMVAAQTLLSVAYGLEMATKDDPYISILEKAVNPLATAAAPGAFLVDELPGLKYVPEWIPGASFKRKAREWNDRRIDMIEIPFADAKKAINSGQFRPSFVSQNLLDVEDNDVDEESIKFIAAVMYTGGSDTTVSAMASCILALLEHPEVLKRAQRELDDVVGLGRLPTFKDMDSLPHNTAVIKETMRWRPVTPINVPHQVIVEDHYQGYRIPAGSLIIQNAWAMLHDEGVYADPFTFNPDRFIKDGKLDPSVRDPFKICFGAGRRICPARFMAFSSIWITMVSLMAVYDIEKSVDKNGNVIEPNHEFISSLVCQPNPITCTIKLRSREAEVLIRESADSEFFHN